MMIPPKQVVVVAEVLCLHDGMIDVLVVEKDGEPCLPWGHFATECNGGESVDIAVKHDTGLDLENLWEECGYEFAADDEDEERGIIHWGLRAPWHTVTDPVFSKRVELHYGVFFMYESLPELSKDGAKWVPIGSILSLSGMKLSGHENALRRFVKPMSSLFPWVWPDMS